MIINNTNLIIDKHDKFYNDILHYFIKIEDNLVKELYYINEDEDIVIDKGLRFLLPKELFENCEDVSSREIDVDAKNDPEFYRNLLDNIVLRDDQILTVIKAVKNKRGLFQLPTGSGKTICIAAILKYYYKMLGYYPNTLIFEPTNYLVDDMVNRFTDYGIPVSKYKDHRNKIDGVVISHPMSLYNDLKDESSVFEEVKIFIGDEFHHQSCETWYSIYNSLVNVEVCLGFSASIISRSKLPITDISKLTYNEAVIIGCTGNIVMDVPVSYYIEKGILAKPVLFRMSNPANEFVYDDKNWHLLREKKLESPNRTKIICKIATMLSLIKYKVLILTSTKNHANNLMKLFNEYGIGNKCVCSFGGGIYLKLDENGNLVDCRNENPKEKFDSGDFNIMIGTTHLYEGADIPNLDAVILASVGRKARKLIQGVGRSLRKSKTGKYAYIFDFDDYQNGILKMHSELRMNMYREIIGIDNSYIYDHCTFDRFKEYFKLLEGL